jgi:predicted tellurium resistance membrane protein TerC
VLGLGFAMFTRIALLLSLAWVMTLTEPLISIGKDISGRDLILIGGGQFLLWTSVHEVHNSLEGEADEHTPSALRAGFAAVIVQIAIIDIVFSLDSVVTAVGMVNQVPVMVLAIVIAVVVMMFAAKPIGEFVDRHPTVKMLALSFLVLIGMALIAEGWGYPIPKGYIYFAMAFSVVVEMLNIRVRARRQDAVKLRKHTPG